MTFFEEGDRVQVRDPEGWIQPWRNRFKPGRAGTVQKVFADGRRNPIFVQWDTKSKRLTEWQLTVNHRDLKHADEDPRP